MSNKPVFDPFSNNKKEIDEERLRIFGKHIRKLRKEKGLIQKKVAKDSGLTESTISEIENGKITFYFSTLIALAKGLDAHPKDLLDLDLKLHLDD